MQYDIYGIGNAIVDLLVEVDDNLIKELNLNKGMFHLIDESQSKEILTKIKYAQMSIIPGGSAANAITTAALLGANTAFLGQVGDDEYGDLYKTETIKSSVNSKLKTAQGMTGHAIVLITPDAERTLVVNLGISNRFSEADIDETEIKNSKILHIDGYLIDQAKSQCLNALKLAKKHNLTISIDASDAGVIERNKADFIHILKEYADIIFANEEEARVLTGKATKDAIQELAQWCDIAIVKCGNRGSLIQQKNKFITVAAVPTNAIDTTGAGDAYAGGFLYGITKNMTLEESGKLASTLASKVVSKIGARLTREEISETPK
jgi:sugar/nucleoside kinase (ribokinase family)